MEVFCPPVIDREHGLVSYRLQVFPGPLYHLRTLNVHNLSAEQEGKARELLGLKTGDVFNEMAVNGLYHKLPTDPLLAPFGFTFSPAKDKTAAAVDLTLDFYKSSDKSSVSIQ